MANEQNKNIKIGVQIIPELKKQDELLKEVEQLLATEKKKGIDKKTENKFKEAKRLLGSLSQFISGEAEITPALLADVEAQSNKLAKNLQEVVSTLGVVDGAIKEATAKARARIEKITEERLKIAEKIEQAKSAAPGRLYGDTYQLWQSTRTGMIEQSLVEAPMTRKTSSQRGLKVENEEQLKRYANALQAEIKTTKEGTAKHSQLNKELDKIREIFSTISKKAQEIYTEIKPLDTLYKELEKEKAALNKEVKTAFAAQKKELTGKDLTPTEQKIQSLAIQADEAIFNVKGAFASEKEQFRETKVAERERKELMKGMPGIDDPGLGPIVDKNTTAIGRAFKQVSIYTMALKTLRTVYRQTIQTIREIDKALTQQAMVSGQTKDQVYALLPAYQKLSVQLGSTSTEVAAVATKYFQQGKNAREALILTEAAVKAAKVASIDTTKSVDYLTTAINGFKMKAEEAIAVSDKFAALAASSATSYEELAIALSKVAAQANLAGLSMDYTLGLLAKGIETTREAPETIGTALKTILARMREITDYGETLEDGLSLNNVEKQLGYVNIELRNTQGELRSTEDVLDEVGRKWETMTNNQQAAIAKALAGTRQQSRLISIMQDYDRTLELVEISSNSLGATSAQQAEYLKGMEAAINKLKTAYQQFTTAISNSKAIIKIVEMLGKGVEFLADMISGKENNWKRWGLMAAAAMLLISQNLDKMIYKLQWFRVSMSREARKFQAETRSAEYEDSLAGFKEVTGARTRKQRREADLLKKQEEVANKQDGAASKQMQAGDKQVHAANTNAQAAGIAPDLPARGGATPTPTPTPAGGGRGSKPSFGMPSASGIQRTAQVMQGLISLFLAAVAIAEIIEGIQGVNKRMAEQSIEAVRQKQDEIYNNIKAINTLTKLETRFNQLGKTALKTAEDLQEISDIRTSVIEELVSLGSDRFVLEGQSDEDLFKELEKQRENTKNRNQELLNSIEDDIFKAQDASFNVGTMLAGVTAGVAAGGGVGSLFGGVGAAPGAAVGGVIGLVGGITAASIELKKAREAEKNIKERLKTEEGVQQIRYTYEARLTTEQLKTTALNEEAMKNMQSTYSLMLGMFDKDEWKKITTGKDKITPEKMMESFLEVVDKLPGSFETLNDSTEGLSKRAKSFVTVQEAMTEEFGEGSEVVKAFNKSFSMLQELIDIFGKENLDILSHFEELYGFSTAKLRTLYTDLRALGLSDEEMKDLSFQTAKAISEGRLADFIAGIEDTSIAKALISFLEEDNASIAAELTKTSSYAENIRKAQAEWKQKTAAEQDTFLSDYQGLFMRDGKIDPALVEQFISGQNIDELIEAFTEAERERLLAGIKEAMIVAEAGIKQAEKEIAELEEKLANGIGTEEEILVWEGALKTAKNTLNSHTMALERAKNNQEAYTKILEKSIAEMVQIQNTQLTLYKKYLEDVAKLEKETLNKQKEAYQKYFTDINQQIKDEDYEKSRDTLLSNIYKLSGSTDAVSLSKLAQLEEKLRDEEKKRMEELRQRGQEALISSIDDTITNIDEKLRLALENDKKLLEALNTMTGVDLIEAALFGTEGKTAADKASILEDWRTAFPTFTESFNNWIDALKAVADQQEEVKKGTEINNTLNFNLGDKTYSFTGQESDSVRDLINRLANELGLGYLVN